ncbi:PREDICTED: motile sperm domain-containing protein 2-like [Ceratosolen solmsi marchali]|uniref:Motile sperm domain-containing protein 2-like n=1 Tax=Ceratosolen solmsi marchali TaxID=326594 RepID=A0AAJ6VM31_9HYME|nr:PREDICTED: motile sperm domain-containing protein 2-like [Ceratosolen solmsi marchali]
MDQKVQNIIELRDKFFKKLDDEGPPNSRNFHSADIDKIKSTDKWLQRFLEHNEFNVQEALKMLWDTCEWRKNFGTNDITENNVRKEYLEAGICFVFGKDKDGKRLFIIKSKLHTKNARDFLELQKCIVYWFERLEREGNGDQISLFFDMVDAGMSNLDMDLTRFLIGLFKNYYPNFLNYIIILEMPWALNAAFSIIKSWLPPKAIPKIKFVKKSTLKDFIEPKSALKCWGDKNDYTFLFVSEPQSINLSNEKPENRKVHFIGNSCSTDMPVTNFGDQTKTEDDILIIEPNILTFSKHGTEVIGTISLTNPMSEQHLSYKIKTTSRDKFKVRPSTGILLATQKATVTITLQTSCSSQSVLGNDRFLIMCLPIENTKILASELIDFWKSNESTAKQYRLICRDGNENLCDQKSNTLYYGNGSSSKTSINLLFSRISEIEERHISLQKDITLLKYFLLISITAILTLLFWIIISFNTNFYNSIKEETCTIDNKILVKHDEI